MALLDFLFGRTKPTPTTTTTIATSKLPEEIGPAAKTIIDEAEALYRQAVEEGYKEFPGETIAPRTAEELAAIEGLRGLVGGQEPYRAEAEQALRATPTQFTADEAQRLMSPYQRAVTDIEKREAQRTFERDIQPALEAQAIQRGGGMSGLGTRAGIQAAEAQRNQSQLLADIEAKGQQRAFEQAYRQFGDETAAQRQRSQDIGQLGTQRFNIGLAEQGLAQQLGQEDRAEAQAILADQYAEFIEREQFPETELAQFSSFVTQSPFVKQGTKTTAETSMLQPTSSVGQQLLGLGLTGLNIYGQATGKNPFQAINPFRKGGGSVGRGLASLPVVKRQVSGRVGLSPLVARTMQKGLPRLMDGREGERKLNEAIRARIMARIKAAEQAGKKYITDADKIAQESIAKEREALMKQFEGADTFSGPTDKAMKALYAPGVETKGLIGALNVALPAFMSERSEMQQERKTKEAEIESESIALQRAASLATVEQENKLADKLNNAQEKIDTAATEAEKADATYDARMAAADLSAIKTATDIYNSMLNSETANVKALTDKAKLGKIDRNDARTVRQIVAGQFGYIFDNEGLKIGGNVLDSTDPRLIEFERVAEILLDKLKDTGKDYNKVQKEARKVAEQRQARSLIDSGNVQTIGNDGMVSITKGRGRKKRTTKEEPKKGTIYKLPSGRFGRYVGNGNFEPVE